jgi:transcriptional regulator with XRE-family HTH domain
MTDAQLSPTTAKQMLGAELKRLREAAGKAREDAAGRLRCSVDKIGALERGRSAANPTELMALLDLYGVGPDEVREIELLADEARRRRRRTPYGAVIPEPIKKFFRLEETATKIRAFASDYVHGLTQGPEYARDVLAANPALSTEDVERLLMARMARKPRLTGPRPVQFDCVMPESTLMLPVGGPEGLRRQLLHTVELMALPNVAIRMLPTSVGACHGFGPSFSIFTVPGAPKVYLENLTDGMVVDEPRRVDRYVVAFEHLVAASLSVEDTARHLATVAAEL